MKKTYALVNLVLIFAVIAWNYIANALGINGNTIGSLSSEYNSLFTPAGYAFSIWGPIFLGLIALGIYMVRAAFSDQMENEFITRLGPWLLLANLANGAWVYFWLNEQTGISVMMMLIILISLIISILVLNMERKEVPSGQAIWVWWPLGIYSGWIAVATIANIAATLAKSDWSFLLSETTWAIVMIIVAAVLNIALILTRRMRDFALVGIWALLAIWARHRGSIPGIEWTAFSGAMAIAVTIMIHWLTHRGTCPILRWRRSGN